MIVVTGGVGFIGSCLVAHLNATGYDDLMLVDHVPPGSIKRRNLTGKKYKKYYDKAEFLSLVRANRLPPDIDCVIHLGACSSTILTDAKYYQENNYEYSCHLARWAVDHGVRFIYASSAATYGDGELGYSDDDQTTRRLRPLNLYGDSKHRFDLWVLDQGWEKRMVGLKFFNVFGPNEYHKGEMRSVVAKAYRRVAEQGTIGLFKSYRPEFSDGEQKRDFIYVKDVVDIMMHFFDHEEINGIYNVGTGQARTWNDLAKAIFKAAGKTLSIEYIDMPEALRKKYQYFTQAQIEKLRGSGYKKAFTSLEEAVADYAGYLREEKIF